MVEEGARKHYKKEFSRGWFRSIDLWVMGPARSHCATLLDDCRSIQWDPSKVDTIGTKNLLINSIISSHLQTMAVATLAACYSNPRVFTGVVKIRKGQAVALMMQSTNMKQLRTIMAQFAREVGMLAI